MTQRPYALAAIAAVTGAALGTLLAIGHAGGTDAGAQPLAQPLPVGPQLARPLPAAPLPAAPQPSNQYAAPAEEPGAVQRDESIDPIQDLSIGA